MHRAGLLPEAALLLTGPAATVCSQRNPVTAHVMQERGGRDLLCNRTNTSKVPYIFQWDLVEKRGPLSWLSGKPRTAEWSFEDNTVHVVHGSNALPG